MWPLLGGTAFELHDLLAMEEQLAPPHRVELAAGVGVGRHVHAVEPDLAVLDARVRVLEVGPAVPQRFHLGPDQHHAALPRLEHEVVVPRLSVGDDDLVAAPTHPEHGTVQSAWCRRVVRGFEPWRRSRTRHRPPRGTASKAKSGPRTDEQKNAMLRAHSAAALRGSSGDGDRSRARRGVRLRRDDPRSRTSDHARRRARHRPVGADARARSAAEPRSGAHERRASNRLTLRCTRSRPMDSISS